MNELNDYVRGMLDKAETFKRASSDDDVQKYYSGKIVAYRNVIKYLQDKQLTIPVVVGQSEQLCDNPHCEDGIVDRDMYGHPIYCQVCDLHN